MEAEIWIILLFSSVLVGILAGAPIAFVLGGLAVVFGYFGMGERVFPMFVNRMWQTATNELLAAIPMFIFMAAILDRSGIAEGLFRALQYALGRFNGALALTVVVLSTVFAAVTGVVGASVISMSFMALPAMLKYGYDKKLATGVVASGGTLGIIIPPSIMLVIMADQSGESVGRLFAGSLLPGLLLAALYFLYVLIRSYLQPDLAPKMSAEERSQYSRWQITRMVLINLVPPVLLIFGVLGSIWAGVATPTEASGIGAFMSLLLMIFYGKFTLTALKESVWTATRTSCMVIMVMVGATLFTQVFLGLGGREVVTNLIMSMDFLDRWGMFLMMMLIVFILGFLLDWVGIILITFPVFLPLAAQLGFDPLWMIVMIAVNLQASFLTPPVGYSLFYMRSTVPPQISMMDIYKGVTPFLLLQLFALILLMVFPQIITWLPSLVGG